MRQKTVSALFTEIHNFNKYAFRQSDMRKAFAEEIDDTLADGDISIIICDGVHAISAAGCTVLTNTFTWPTLSVKLVVDLLRLTHSATGLVADKQIFAVLPPNVTLAP